MRAWLEINLEAISRNYDLICQEVGSDVGVIAVVKSNAYGHGIEQVCKLLDGKSVDMFAVISLEEARAVRQVSERPVLIMGYLDTKEIIDAVEEGYVLSLYDKELAVLYERIGSKLGRKIKAHLKVESGLNRLGLSETEAVDLLASSRHFPHLVIEAIFSHLHTAADRKSDLEQLKVVQQLLIDVQGKSPLLPIHLSSSYALGKFSEGYFDAVRVGLALYGVDEVLSGLEPSLTCKTMVMQVKPINKGEGVSYGHLFIAPRQMEIAVLSMGYAEGLSQAMTGELEVLIKGKKVPVVGQICMNLMIADVTGLGIKRGEEAVVIGSQKNEQGEIATLRVSDIATRTKLRHHEILTRLGTALPKIYY